MTQTEPRRTVEPDTRTEPGLVDLQVNGYRGLDINGPGLTEDVVVDLTQSLWAEGVTTYLPTIITAPEAEILDRLAVIAAARRADPLIAHSIAGVHIEGPSLSPEDGPRGVHSVEHLRDPEVAELERWQSVASENLVRIVTLAPERAGSEDYIRAARAMGVHVSLGHCAPSPDHIRDAVNAGASLSTHLGNGCHATLPRHPNHLWAQLAEPRLNAMLITDGDHLPADTATAMMRAKGPEKCIMTSDSAALAGLPMGEYTTPVGGRVTVNSDGRLNVAGTAWLAGSGRSLRRSLDWAKSNLPFEPATLHNMASRNPARTLGEEDRLRSGAEVVEIEHGKVAKTTIGGVVVYRKS